MTPAPLGGLMRQSNAEKDMEKGDELPAPPGEYWTVKIDVAAWLQAVMKFPMLPWRSVPSLRYSKKSICVFVFAKTPELEAALQEFWHPVQQKTKDARELIDGQKSCRYIKAAAEK